MGTYIEPSSDSTGIMRSGTYCADRSTGHSDIAIQQCSSWAGSGKGGFYLVAEPCPQGRSCRHTAYVDPGSDSTGTMWSLSDRILHSSLRVVMRAVVGSLLDGSK